MSGAMFASDIYMVSSWGVSNVSIWNGLGRSAPGLRGGYRYRVSRHAARFRVVYLRVECTQVVCPRALRPSGSRHVPMFHAACPGAGCPCAENPREID